MQSRLPISKPLLLVLIGLIIGASLGLGSGYAVFYPNLVNQRSRTIEDRVLDIEEDVAIVGTKIESMNGTMSSIEDNLDGILALSDVIQQLSDRISDLETGESSLSDELGDLEDTLSQLNEDFVTLTDEWEATEDNFADLQTAYEAANDELESVQALVRENDGIRIYTAYMANPSDGFKDDITDEIHFILKSESTEYVNLIDDFDENFAKNRVRQELNALMGSLVWNPTENTEVGSDSYQVQLETYFDFEISSTSVSVSKMHIEVKATVNIDTDKISSKTVSLVEVI